MVQRLSMMTSALLSRRFWTILWTLYAGTASISILSMTSFWLDLMIRTLLSIVFLSHVMPPQLLVDPPSSESEGTDKSAQRSASTRQTPCSAEQLLQLDH